MFAELFVKSFVLSMDNNFVFNVNHGENENCTRVMLNVLSKYRDGLRVCHINARSLNSRKLDYLRYLLCNSSIDVICIDETWFHPNDSDELYKIDNYNLYRNDRVTSTTGGGVAIYCKSSLNCRMVIKSYNESVEYLIIEIYDGHQKCLISCCYIPDRRFSPEPFFSALSEFSPVYDNIIVCGDFNANLLKRDSRAHQMKDFVSSCGLTILNDSVPTCFRPNAPPSLLDFIIVSDPSSVLVYDQLSLEGISEHDLLFCTYNISFSYNIAPMSFQFKDFRSIDIDSLHTAASSIPWEQCRLKSDPNDKLKCLQLFLAHLYDTYVPIKTVSIRNKACPWFTSAVLSALKSRNKLYSKWKQNRSQLNWVAYKVARNKATYIVRESKRNYYSSKLSTSLPPKMLWKNLRNIGIGNKGCSNCPLDPDELNNYFLANNAEPSGLEFVFSLDAHAQHQAEFEVVSEDEVLSILASFKSNATGEDGVPLRFVKIVLPHILSHLTHIINFCIMTSTFPQAWKYARVIPVAKKSNAAIASDYRPISILPCLSKVFEKVLAKQIQNHLSVNSLLNPFQSGFRTNHSCSSAMVNILDDVRQEFDKGFVTLLCLLDFSKAFDKVNHSILCWKLKNFFGFGERAVRLLESFLSNRWQRVVVEEKCSSLKPLTLGVPQGSILGPILFCLFINDLPLVCKHVSVHLYADDVQLYLSQHLNRIDELVSHLNEDLAAINDWSVKNGLFLNPAKSQVVPISKRLFDLSFVPDIRLSNNKLQLVESVTTLGFVINRNLSCYNHVNLVIGRIYGCLRKLWLTASFTPIETRRKLVLTLIIPIITYAEVVYCSLDSLSQHKLQVAFNDAVRYVHGLRRYDRISVLSKNLLGCTLQQYLNARACIFLHKIIISKSPPYLFCKLKFSRSRRTFNINIPCFKYLNSSRLFFIHAIRLWNSLPLNIKGTLTTANYKIAIFSHFSSQQ